MIHHENRATFQKSENRTDPCTPTDQLPLDNQDIAQDELMNKCIELLEFQRPNQ